MDCKQLERKIAELNDRVNGRVFTRKDGLFWRETWALVKEIGADFKTARFATREDQESAWRQFQGIVEQMKTEADRHQRERTERAQVSESAKADIIRLAYAAWPRPDGFQFMAETLVGITFAKLFGHMALDFGRALLGMDAVDPHEREKQRLTELSTAMKRAWDTFSSRKNELTPMERTGCFNVLEKVQAELNKAWEEWKAEAQGRRDQRDSVFEKKRNDKSRLIAEMKSLAQNADDRDAKDSFDGLMAEWKEIGFAGKGHEEALWSEFKSAMDSFWSARKSAYRQRLEARLANQEAFLEKLEESVRHDEGVVEDKREKLSNVFEGRRADEIRAGLGSAIESLETKIGSKNEKIEELETEIAELRQKLREIH